MATTPTPPSPSPTPSPSSTSPNTLSAVFTEENLSKFHVLLEEWEKSQSAPKGFDRPYRGGGSVDVDLGGADRAGKDVVVAFRTRPPLAEELTKLKLAASGEAPRGQGGDGNEDGGVATFCPGISVTSAEPGVTVGHVPAMKWTGPTLTHKSFEADLAFGPDVSNNEVYARTIVAQDVLNLVLGGGVSCILAYGQTGSGKTYTMEGLEHRIARDLFPAAETLTKRTLNPSSEEASSDETAEDQPKNIFQFTVSFLEILGKHASDLIQEHEYDKEGNVLPRKSVAILEDKVGEVRPRITETSVHSSEELQTLISQSLSHRRTSATERNSHSSRSHAILTIRVKNTKMPFVDDGLLILVDLAGSERYEDSKRHSKQRMEESRENNKTLMGLKDCVRAKARSILEDGFFHIPYRANKLTLTLKPIFDLESRRLSKTVVIAHVSPHLQDAAHSVNTLTYAAPFKITLPRSSASNPNRQANGLKYDAKDPRTWNYEQTVTWLKGEFKKKAGARSILLVNNTTSAVPQETSEDQDPIKASLPIDLDKFCPPGMSARNFGRLYSYEWLERCQKARKPEAGSQDWKVTGYTTMAMQVYGQLNYLLLSARTKTRNVVMKSRATYIVEDLYGQSGYDAHTVYESTVYSQEDIAILQELHGDELDKLAIQAWRKARGQKETHEPVLKEMMEKYKVEIEGARALKRGKTELKGQVGGDDE